jgi:hypothetical protein
MIKKERRIHCQSKDFLSCFEDPIVDWMESTLEKFSNALGIKRVSFFESKYNFLIIFSWNSSNVFHSFSTICKKGVYSVNKMLRWLHWKWHVT